MPKLDRALGFPCRISWLDAGIAPTHTTVSCRVTSALPRIGTTTRRLDSATFLDRMEGWLMAKKAAVKKSEKDMPVTITYDLFDLPTAQHKAGLAGPSLQIESMRIGRKRLRFTAGTTTTPTQRLTLTLQRKPFSRRSTTCTPPMSSRNGFPRRNRKSTS